MKAQCAIEQKIIMKKTGKNMVALIEESVRRTLNEWLDRSSLIEKWDECKDACTPDGMLDWIWNTLSTDEIEDILRTIDRNEDSINLFPEDDDESEYDDEDDDEDDDEGWD